MLTIRRMKESDIPEVARLEKEIFPDPWGDKRNIRAGADPFTGSL